MVGTRKTPSSGRKGCRELKGLVNDCGKRLRIKNMLKDWHVDIIYL